MPYHKFLHYALKSGNAVILKGGREAQHSNKVIVSLITDAIDKVDGVPTGSVQMIKTRSEVAGYVEGREKILILSFRVVVTTLLNISKKIPEYRFLVTPKVFVMAILIQKQTPDKAISIALDSKLQYPAACNAMETLLVHKNIADKILPPLVKQFCFAKC